MPYTAGLIASIPRLGRSNRGQRLRTIPGNVPSLAERPAGCRFVTRCSHAQPACARTLPPLEAVAAGHEVRCLRWQELNLTGEGSA